MIFEHKTIACSDTLLNCLPPTDQLLEKCATLLIMSSWVLFRITFAILSYFLGYYTCYVTLSDCAYDRFFKRIDSFRLLPFSLFVSSLMMTVVEVTSVHWLGEVI